uniref:Endonuclease/exonuclease/phosphatase domain-containing protein n=1 Tax=Lepisosteus oculatus TaxID=7918 RepID=W5MY25_LEPOC
HVKFDHATYVHSDVTYASLISSSTFCDVIQVKGFRIANVYKPPSEHWDQGMLPTLEHPTVYVGDFNSHHLGWGYSEPDEDGEKVVEWPTNNDLIDPKQCGTFHSARWQKKYSVDFSLVTTIGNHPQPVSQRMLDDFPHSQHRPLLIHIGLQLSLIHSSAKKCWNFRKADWELYSNTLECCIPIKEAYQHFQGAIFKAASMSIPHGCRRVFTPCLNEECKSLFEEHKAPGDPVIADHLVESMDSTRQSHWEKLNFIHLSQKCWSIICRLGAAQEPPVQARSAVSPNANHLLQVAKAPLKKKHQSQVRDEWRQYCLQKTGGLNGVIPETFKESELYSVLRGVNSGSAAGYDNILPEFLKHL